MKPPRTLLPLGLLVASVAVIVLSPFSFPRGIAEQKGSDSDSQLRYARALNELAKHELQQAIAQNQKVDGVNSNVTLQRLKNNALIAEERLQFALSGTEPSLHQVHLREVEGNFRVAELDFQNAVQLNERVPGMISADEVTRLRMTVEVARLALARAQDPAAIKSHDAHVRWQLDYLRQEVLRLHTRMAEVESLARR